MRQLRVRTELSLVDEVALIPLVFIFLQIPWQNPDLSDMYLKAC